MLTKYTPSGKLGALSLAALLVFVPIAIAGAWLYNLCMEWIPLIYLDALIVVGFAVGLGWIVNRGLRLTRCRNRSLAMAAGLLTGITAVATSHYLQFESLQPVAIKQIHRRMTATEYIRFRVDTGFTIGHGSPGSGGGLPISGVFVWIIWGIEALVITAGATMGAGAVGTPFCEGCGKWADTKDAEIRVDFPSPESLVQVKDAKSVVDLLDITNLPDDTRQYLVYVLHRCPGCDKLPTLTVKVNQTIVQKGKETTKTVPLHAAVLLTDAEAQTVRELASGALPHAGTAAPVAAEPPAPDPTA